MSLQDNYTIYLNINELINTENIKTPYLTIIINNNQYATDVGNNNSIYIRFIK